MAATPCPPPGIAGADDGNGKCDGQTPEVAESEDIHREEEECEFEVGRLGYYYDMRYRSLG